MKEKYARRAFHRTMENKSICTYWNILRNTSNRIIRKKLPQSIIYSYSPISELSPREATRIVKGISIILNQRREMRIVPIQESKPITHATIYNKLIRACIYCTSHCKNKHTPQCRRRFKKARTTLFHHINNHHKQRGGETCQNQ